MEHTYPLSARNPFLARLDIAYRHESDPCFETDHLTLSEHLKRIITRDFPSLAATVSADASPIDGVLQWAGLIDRASDEAPSYQSTWVRFGALTSARVLALMHYSAAQWNSQIREVPHGTDYCAAWEICRHQWLFMHEASYLPGDRFLCDIRQIDVRDWIWHYLSMDYQGFPLANGYSFSDVLALGQSGHGIFPEGLETLRATNDLSTRLVRIDPDHLAPSAPERCGNPFSPHDLGWDLEDHRLDSSFVTWVRSWTEALVTLSPAYGDDTQWNPWAPFTSSDWWQRAPVMRRLALLASWGHRTASLHHYRCSAWELYQAWIDGSVQWPTDIIALRYRAPRTWSALQEPPILSWQHWPVAGHTSLQGLREQLT